MKSESELTQELLPTIKRTLYGSEVFKISDKFTSGIPDVSVNWLVCYWLEIKATETPKLEYHKHWGRQLLVATRLERTMKRCFFVVYFEMDSEKSVAIYPPHQVRLDLSLGTPLATFRGHDHQAVATFLQYFNGYKMERFK